MKKVGMFCLLIAGLAACQYESGKAVSGINSSAPNAVASAASGTTGGGENAFTHSQISAGSPAGANLNLLPQPAPP